MSLSVFPFLVPFSFVLSFRLVVFCLFLVSPSSHCFPFPGFLGGGFCHSVFSSRRYKPPALIVSLKHAYYPSMLSTFLRCWCWTLDIFLLFLPFFDFDLDIACFILSFSCGYYSVSSVSVSAATRFPYDMYICIVIRTYADLTFLFQSGAYNLFQLLCELSLVFVCFPPQSSAPELLEPVLWPRNAL